MTPEEQNKILLENRKMRRALTIIRNWQLPMIDDGTGGKASYELMLGSNGARDYMRQIADDALD